MRKKTKQPLDIANLTDAWNAFFESNRALTDESLREQGWLDINTVAEKTGMSSTAISRLKNLEIKVFRVKRNGSIKNMRYCRKK